MKYPQPGRLGNCPERYEFLFAPLIAEAGSGLRLYFRLAVQVPSPNSPSITLPFMLSLLSIVPV